MNYVSYACSKYHPIFESLGYPRLDVVEFEDGEWAVREFLTMPIVPSLTKWNFILQGMRNVEIRRDFLKHQITLIDPMKPWLHQRERQKTQEMLDEKDRVEQHREESAEAAKKLIMGNEGLVNRVVSNGLKEINLDKIASNMEPWKLRGLT